MEYLFLLGLGVLLVIIILLLHPVHRESQIRELLNNQNMYDREQARRHREFQHSDTTPNRAHHKTNAELVGQFVRGKTKDKDKGAQAEAWTHSMEQQGYDVWLEGNTIRYHSTKESHGGNVEF